MKRQRIPLADAAGKIVAGIAGVCDDRLILFTDGTYVYLGVDHGHEGDASVEDMEYVYGDSDVSIDQLIKIGFFTQEEVDQLGRERSAESRARFDQQERNEYLRLKTKFEIS